MAAGTGTVIAHDAPASGRTYVGDLQQFDVLDLGDNLLPDFHQQNHIRVTQSGATVFETTADSGHDYDGVNAFALSFPQPGPYSVEALDDHGMAIAGFSGNVSEPNHPQAVHIGLDLPVNPAALVPATFTYSLLDANGTLVPHSDALFEVRQAGALLFRTHTHSHTEKQSLAYMFPAPGNYQVRIVGYLAYATGHNREFTQAVSTSDLLVVAAPPMPAVPPLPMVPPSDMNLATSVPAGTNCTLVGTFDPYTQVGPYTQQHLEVLVMETHGHATVQHVNFKAKLTGPLGVVFTSETLHEYDGIYDLAVRESVFGTYTLSIDADKGAGCTGHIDLSYAVVPVGFSTSAGPQLYDVGGLDHLVAGIPANLTLFAHDPAGNPFAHSEVDLQWLDANGAITLQAKLHTHADGKFAFTYAPPTAGAGTLRISPTQLDAGFTPVFYGAKIGDNLDFPVTVAPSLLNTTGAAGKDGVNLQAEIVPGLELPAISLVVIGAALLVVRRRAA